MPRLCISKRGMINTMQNRNQTLDLLRGIGIIIMVITHCFSYYLKNKFVFFLWDWSHFVVVTFVFVSGYLFFKKSQQITGGFFNYFKKRIWRLLAPYYIFLIFMLGVIWFFEPKNITLSFILQNLTLTGGIDINWLTILFIYFVFINPLILYLSQKKWAFYLYFLLSLGAAILFLFYYPNPQYKLVMWLPWSLVSFFSYYFIKNEGKKQFFLFTSIVGLAVFLRLRFFLGTFNHTLVLQYNKYPPNLYYLSYGITCVTILYYFFSKINFWPPLKNGINFFSRYSYEIFFSHWFVLYVISKLFAYWNWQWWQFTGVVFIASVITQLAINKVVLLLGNRKS